MKTMVLLYGGVSVEHDVSRISAAGILRHFPLDEFEPVPVGIDMDGAWRLQNPEALLEQAREGVPLPIGEGMPVVTVPGSGLAVCRPDGTLRSLRCDVVFPVLHGTYGEDGSIQGLLEVAGLPYVGSGILASALGMDKEKSKDLWRAAGLPVVDSVTVRARDLDDGSRTEALIRTVDARFGWPVFVKPACAGSSVGASRVASSGELEPALREALRWGFKALVEPFVSAREIECAVLGDGTTEVFMPGEILPSHEFYDYDAKYVDPEGARLEIPARIPGDRIARVQELALQAYRICEFEGMARVDFFIDRMTGEIMLNEANTIPGFTHISMYPRMCEAGGMPFHRLIAELGRLGMERSDRKRSILFRYGDSPEPHVPERAADPEPAA